MNKGDGVSVPLWVLSGHQFCSRETAIHSSVLMDPNSLGSHAGLGNKLGSYLL